VFLDSTLVVNTVNGDWKLEAEHLKPLCTKACVLVKKFADIKLSWVPREMNREADALASRAPDSARSQIGPTGTMLAA
jgi:ribonuclease HI